jgi:hypothetical protein
VKKEGGTGDKPFSSWKEIAAYLGCDERTCLRWEKQHGLPIHRIGDSQVKSHVFAYREELDEWLRRRKEGESASGPSRRGWFSLRRRWPLYLALAAAAALVVLIGAGVLGQAQSGSQQPYDFRIERSVLIVANKQGRELWRYDTGLADLVDDAGYHQRFNRRRAGITEGSILPLLVIRDLDDDGRNEVLIGLRTIGETTQLPVLCFDSRGRKLWTYEPGREMVFGTKRYSADYVLDAVEVIEGGRGGKTVLIMARQKPDFPTYIAVLSPQGETLGEYWNSGRFNDYILADASGKGWPDIILVGTNNEYAKGVLVVLDSDSVWGGSPQTGYYRCPDLKPGSELYYLLLPRTEVDRLGFSQRGVVSYVEALARGRIMAITDESRIVFEFGPRLEVDTAIVSDAYREKYRNYQAEGRIPPGPLDAEALARSLAQGVVYYDGEHWTTTPTPNKRNAWILLQQEEGPPGR